MPDINEKYVIYYAVRGYRTGQTIAINIYDSLAAKEIDSGSMTELGTTGIYYFNFRPRKRTAYVAVMDCSAYPRQAHQVIRIEKQKLGGAVKIHHVKVPDPVWKEKDKKKIFGLLKKIPAQFPKISFPKIEPPKEINMEKIFSLLQKEILSRIPKPQKIPSMLFEELLNKYSAALDTRFKPIAEELNRLFILSDEININQKLNIPPEKSKISPEEDATQLMMKYGTASNGSSGKETTL